MKVISHEGAGRLEVPRSEAQARRSACAGGFRAGGSTAQTFCRSAGLTPRRRARPRHPRFEFAAGRAVGERRRTPGASVTRLRHHAGGAQAGTRRPESHLAAIPEGPRSRGRGVPDVFSRRTTRSHAGDCAGSRVLIHSVRWARTAGAARRAAGGRARGYGTARRRGRSNARAKFGMDEGVSSPTTRARSRVAVAGWRGEVVNVVLDWSLFLPRRDLEALALCGRLVLVARSAGRRRSSIPARMGSACASSQVLPRARPEGSRGRPLRRRRRPLFNAASCPRHRRAFTSTT